MNFLMKLLMGKILFSSVALLFNIAKDILTVAFKLLALILRWIFGLSGTNTITGHPYVVDGDGLVFDGDIRIRLYGLDAPEMDHFLGKPSKDYLTWLIGNRPVTVKIMSEDKYGRKVGVVYDPDGQDLNARMVKDGYARAYTSFSTAYAGLERQAKRKGAGLWPTGGMDLHPEFWRKHMR